MKNMTRNPERIEHILEKIKKVWQFWPDMRLGQLIDWLSEGRDTFYIEDDNLEEALDEMIKKIKEIRG